ncbi:MAG: hypothetical protein R3Y56_09580 [Akkermansia sp.]
MKTQINVSAAQSHKQNEFETYLTQGLKELHQKQNEAHAQNPKTMAQSFDIGNIIIEPALFDSIKNDDDAKFQIDYFLGHHSVGDCGELNYATYLNNEAQFQQSEEKRGEIYSLWGYSEQEDQKAEFITNFQANVTVIRREGSKFMAA